MPFEFLLKWGKITFLCIDQNQTVLLFQILLIAYNCISTQYQLMTTHAKAIVFLFILALAKAEPTLTDSQAWGYGFLVGFGVSLIGFGAALLLICFQKCLGQTCFKYFVNMLYALSCGALIGDAAIHILPTAYVNQATNPNLVALVLICSIAFFLFLQRAFQACGVAHKHWEGDNQEQHQHNHQSKDQQHNASEQTKNKPVETQKINIIQSPTKKTDQNKPNLLSQSSEIVLIQNVEDISKQNQKNQTPEEQNKQIKKGCWQNLKGKGSAGYLNLLSSFIHNFFDGLSLGVAFSTKDKDVYVPMIIAIVAHQIPRQMGDVGVLFKSGFSGIQTVLCNGVINLVSVIGVFIGLGIGSLNEQAQNYVMTFVAGNFIYIAADIWRNLLKNKKKVMNTVEIFMFALGVGLMFIVLLAESDSGHDH